MANNFWDSEKEVGRVEKNNKGDIIIIKRVTKKGSLYVDVRTYYHDKLDQLQPGKGIAIPDDLADEVALLIMGDTKRPNIVDEEDEEDDEYDNSEN